MSNIRTSRHPFSSPYIFGDRVHIDKDESILGTVTGLLFRPNEAHPTVEVAWLHNGAAYNAWIESWRLQHVSSAEPGVVVPLRPVAEKQ